MSTGYEGDGSAQQVEWFAGWFQALRDSVETYVKGKSGVVRMALVCMLSEGHLLIDDVPGVGKTTMAKVMARSIGGSISRIQFTPDLLPTDVTGVQVFNAKTHEFEFRPGGVFANIVVGDEINRASPKTQAALLEVMEERHVTVDGTAMPVPRPFMVVATQNPIEFEGTYQLPEAQIDRFLMRLSMGYPDHESEVEVVANRIAGRQADAATAVLSMETAQMMIDVARQVHVSPPLYSYAVTIVAATRRMAELRLGISPRGSLGLVTAAQTLAASEGRPFVTADDVKQLAPFVLGHRMLLTPETELQGTTAQDLLDGITSTVPVPKTRSDVSA